MPDHREPLNAERLGQGENIVDQRVCLVVVHVLREVRTGEPALVGHDEKEVLLKPRCDHAPGAMRFGEAVEEDDGGILWIARQRDIERDAGAEAELAELGHG